MARGHYGLQALLYTAALHRYLRWRLPGYDPERNLAGVFYLFVRGMLGLDTPTIDGTPCGVFAWRPPSRAVAGLSDILDGGGRVTRTRGRSASTSAARCGRPALLREFNEAGVLAAADVHVARRLAELAGEQDERVLLAVALAVRAPRHRSRTRRSRDHPQHGNRRHGGARRPLAAAVARAGGWVERVAASGLVAVGEDAASPSRPFRLVGTWLYLDRYWREERRVASDLLA